jgi:ferredoxin
MASRNSKAASDLANADSLKDVSLFNKTRPLDMSGTAGNYRLTFSRNGNTTSVTAGTVIVDVSEQTDNEDLPLLLQKALGNQNTTDIEPEVSILPGVFFCGTGDGLSDDEATIQGLAAAGKATVFLSKGTVKTRETSASVDVHRCRGCGTCVSVCPFSAVTLHEKSPGTFISEVDELLCHGCGICVAHCPSGALSQHGCNDEQIIASLEAILR